MWLSKCIFYFSCCSICTIGYEHIRLHRHRGIVDVRKNNTRQISQYCTKFDNRTKIIIGLGLNPADGPFSNGDMCQERFFLFTFLFPVTFIFNLNLSVFVCHNTFHLLSDHNILITKLKRFILPNRLLQWFQSYLSHRCQRVKIDSCHHLEVAKRRNASGFATRAFIIHSLDWWSPCSVWSESSLVYDDTTLSPSSAVRVYFSLPWTAINNMQINTSKTKEIYGSSEVLNEVNFPRLSITTGSVERVTSFKHLGINVSISIIDKASKRLYFLQQLVRTGVPTDQLLLFYVAHVARVTCTPVWDYIGIHWLTPKIPNIVICR